MNKELFKKLLPAFIAFVAVTAYFTISMYGVKHNEKFAVKTSTAVEQTVDPETGQYVAGSPAITHVKISPALAWEFSSQHNKVFIFLGYLLLLALFALFIAAALEYLPEGFPFNIAVGVCLAIIMAFFFAAYSSMQQNNWIEMSPEKFEMVKDNLEQLFRDKKNIIR